MAKVKIQGHASGTGILTVTAPNTSTDRTITLPDATGTLLNSDGSAASLTAIPAANITGTLPAISGASLTGVNAVNSGRKNMIINGAMNVAQRATSVTGITGSDIRTTDRMKFVASDAGTWTMAQEALTSGAAQAGGFGYATRLDCTTADASVAVGSYCMLEYKLEGQDLQGLAKGTTGANAFTISFWVKTSTTGVYQLTLRDEESRMVAGTYTVSSADTWEKKSITIPADTSGAIDNDNSTGLKLEFWLAGGTNFTSGTIPTTWTASDNTKRAASLSHQMSSATSKDWAITGLQMELGSVATDFEHRSYGEELALCQRYYEFATYGGVVLTGYSSSVGRGSIYLSTPKRIEGYTATVVVPDNTAYWGNASHTGITFTTSQHEVQCIRVNTNSAPANSSLYANNIEIRVDAEL
jgi:hypothetical protein